MNEVKKYLDKVCEQIRFQKAHESIKTELQQHIIDQAHAYMEEGMEEQKAFEKAVAEMGDPVLVGTELDRVHRPKLQWSIIIFVALLSFAHIAVQYIFLKDIFYVTPFYQNVTMLIVFVGIMSLFYHIDFTIFAKHSVLILIAYILLMWFVVFFTHTDGYFFSVDVLESFPRTGMGVFTEIYYTLFYADFGGNMIPIAIPMLIYVFPIVFTAMLYHMRGKSYKSLVFCGCSIMVANFWYCHKLTDVSFMLVGAICFILMILGIKRDWFAVKKSYAYILVTIMIVFFIAFLFGVRGILYDFYWGVSPYKRYIEYIQSILQYNLKYSCIIGQSKDIFVQDFVGEFNINGSKLLANWAEFLPAYILHCGGWVVLLLMLVIYFFFMIKGFLLIKKQKSQFGSMIATAILLLFLGISLWNIIANSGVLLVTNPLGIPFFSTSDSVNVIFFAMLGVLLSVFRTGRYDITEQNNTTTQNKKKFITVSENNIYITIPIFWRRKQRH